MGKQLTVEEIRTKYYEEKAFDELKNVYFPGGWHYIDAMYGKYGVDAHALYRRIMNYRIKTFGTSYITQSDFGITKSTEVRIKEAQRANKRYKSRIGRR